MREPRETDLHPHRRKPTLGGWCEPREGSLLNLVTVLSRFSGRLASPRRGAGRTESGTAGNAWAGAPRTDFRRCRGVARRP